ncbi:YbaL family putative K(+) efflux transporter [Massilia pseudoviolaceinigra]|uniref:YbaL family putative K(+) efflux transporter n=1 Tax=Massilia pseudoviolaceinigra TaxID=3057165 RepID=UPI002796BB0D|nr:YbaL family putative K(+) efflux transporter [Massilia sp. CCM 9206]MDQ1919901.1 YbaL family putative K(+) efflux transporter [Massilia sp. CCM 9206]
MHHNISLITTIAAALGFGLIFGMIAVRFKLPALVGYLAAGIVIGPATPGFVADVALAGQLAEIGVMLLMFGVGLHFSLDDLMEVRGIALPGAVLQIGAATGMGIGMAYLWGWSLGAGLVFGLALSVASTVVLLRALEDLGILDSINGRIAVGWLVVEDLVTVLMLVMLPALAGILGGTTGDSAAAGANIWKTLAITLGQVAAFIVFMLVVGRKLFPWFLWRVARTGSRELFTLAVVATAVGIAYGSSELFGVSFALGAFFAGMVLRESPLSHRAAEESLPLRDAFSVLFFVSVGMLADPMVLVESPLRVLAVVGVIMFGKSLVAFALVVALRYPLNTALTVSASLAQIGEFSFILAALGMSLGLLPKEGQSLILAGAIISIALNPLLFKTIEPLQRWLRSKSDAARKLERSTDPLAELPMSVPQERLSGQVVLVGYGRVGRMIADALMAQGVHIVVAEQNRELVDHLRKRDIAAVVGNAAEPAVLIQAHIARAALLVIATPDTFHVRAMIETARALNPGIRTLVRTHNEEEAELLRKETGSQVFVGERELARSMAEQISVDLAAVKPGHGGALNPPPTSFPRRRERRFTGWWY